MTGMVTVNGVRYRTEDAERLGLLEKQTKSARSEAKARRPRNKAATPANK
jgi:hypothetical protein